MCILMVNKIPHTWEAYDICRNPLLVKHKGNADELYTMNVGNLKTTLSLHNVSIINKPLATRRCMGMVGGKQKN